MQGAVCVHDSCGRGNISHGIPSCVCHVLSLCFPHGGSAEFSMDGVLRNPAVGVLWNGKSRVTALWFVCE